MAQDISPRSARDWTSFESYAGGNDTVEAHKLIVRSADWIRQSDLEFFNSIDFGKVIYPQGFDYIVPRVAFGNYLNPINSVRAAGNYYHYLALGQIKNGILTSAIHEKLISEGAASHIALQKHIDLLTEAARVASLAQGVDVQDVSAVKGAAKISRVLNGWALIAIVLLMASAVLLYFSPKAGLVAGFLAFVSISIVGSRVDKWKNRLTQGVSSDGV